MRTPNSLFPSCHPCWLMQGQPLFDQVIHITRNQGWIDTSPNYRPISDKHYWIDQCMKARSTGAKDLNFTHQHVSLQSERKFEQVHIHCHHVMWMAWIKIKMVHIHSVQDRKLPSSISIRTLCSCIALSNFRHLSNKMLLQSNSSSINDINIIIITFHSPSSRYQFGTRWKSSTK